MINDSKFPCAKKWKYVDDTTVAEFVKKGNSSTIQSDAMIVHDWSHENKLQLNADKCKEMTIDFKKQKHSFDPITVEGMEFKVVNHARILGVTISNTLQWNDHISDVISKSNKRLYFIVLLKRACVPIEDIVMFYCTCIRPVLEYCAPVFHHSLPNYLSDDLERVQKRVLSILSPGVPYQQNLKNFKLPTLQSRRKDLCDKLFKKIMCNPLHKLHDLLPQRHQPKYNLRKKTTFNIPQIKTKRYRNTFIPSMCHLYNDNF